MESRNINIENWEFDIDLTPTNKMEAQLGIGLKVEDVWFNEEYLPMGKRVLTETERGGREIGEPIGVREKWRKLRNRGNPKLAL